MEDRWNIWCFCDFGEARSWIEDWKNPYEQIIEDCEFHRYETISIDYLIDILWDHFQDKFGSENWYEDAKEEAKLNKKFEEYMIPFKEQVLEKFIRSYKWDW